MQFLHENCGHCKIDEDFPFDIWLCLKWQVCEPCNDSLYYMNNSEGQNFLIRKFNYSDLDL